MLPERSITSASRSADRAGAAAPGGCSGAWMRTSTSSVPPTAGAAGRAGVRIRVGAGSWFIEGSLSVEAAVRAAGGRDHGIVRREHRIDAEPALGPCVLLGSE